MAKERADEFGITGVTFQLTLGVAKNIIPAVASTNAIISASCATEAFKILTGCGVPMNDYYLFVGDENCVGSLFQHEKIEDCRVCQLPDFIALEDTDTLKDMLDKIKLE